MKQSPSKLFLFVFNYNFVEHLMLHRENDTAKSAL